MNSVYRFTGCLFAIGNTLCAARGIFVNEPPYAILHGLIAGWVLYLLTNSEDTK